MKLRMALGAFFILTSACSTQSTSPTPHEPQGSSSTSPGDLITCAQDTDTRVLEIKKNSNSGCELIYTKFGTSKAVASSSNSDKHCREVREKISANLNRSGFKCE